MADIIGLVLPFFGMIFLGYVVARITRQPIEALGWLNTFIIYIALPALFFKLVAKTPIEQLTRIDFILANVSATYLVFTLIFAAGLLLRRATTREATIQGLAAAYGNIGYMGPGLALLAFGEPAAVPVALIFCFENMLHFSIAPALMALGGGEKQPLHRLAAGVARRIVTHPFIIATAAGFLAAFTGFEAPAPLQRLIDYLAQAAAPCALFAMGVTLALRPLKRVPVEIGYIVPAKLVLLPVTMYLMLGLAGSFDPVWVYTAVLLAALPTATNVFVIGQQYGVWQERASATILVTTVLSVATVTALLYLVKSGLLPADPFP
ncbi:AEC family transporter [Shinella sp. AETb1-6]|uniref:AEC family transporter n=1 Tax=Shinella TaxID=323620 RepID=UPI00106E694F|nr:MULTISPECIES: AEC family transporter [Shinella]MCD1264584.1 AEC family transporter [Shinella sumterensis]MXN53313.1 AEC family transporter [Shinella sp. AETb1-6]TFE98463.1 malonate transporter [Shinella sumterensis]WLS08371.1 AEC family transporter [Shinella sumterensis]